MSAGFQREYLARLPLPLAQLYARAHNGKEVRGRHDNSFYLYEATLKLAAAPAVAAYLRDVEFGEPRVAALDRLLATLALPSLGQWLAMLRELARHFGQRSDADRHPLGHLWQQLSTPRRDLPAVVALYGRTKNGPDGQPAGDKKSCSLLQMFDALVQYRNLVLGHGAARAGEFYEEMERLLFAAATELLADGVLDMLGPRGTRLVYLTELRRLDDQRVEVGLWDLVGTEGERSAPLVLSRQVADTLLPGQVCVLWPGRSTPLPVHPLLVYRTSEIASDVLFLNRDRNGRQVEYLSYTSGRTERTADTTQALAELLSRVTGHTIDQAQLASLAEHSLAETPSIEGLFAPQPPAGRLLGGYEVLGELGRGGMGVVYLARQTSLGRLVALKTLPADLADDEVSLARFRREIRHLARCEHPHIVKVLDSGTLPDGRLFYAMEYVPGCNLELVWRELSGSKRSGDTTSLGSSTWARAVLSASQKQRSAIRTPSAHAENTRSNTSETAAELPLPPLPDLPSVPDDSGGYTRRVCQLVRDAALALQTVHEQQIVHRDIKPANLMLTPDGSRVVLMDFGLAKGETMALTASLQAGLLGTLRYAAPEQLAAASHKIGPAADVRGLGVTLWELLSRRRLFAEAEDERQLTHQIEHNDVPRLRSIDPAFDRDLEAIVARATERNATDRIPTAVKLAEYLQLYLDGQPLPIRPPSLKELWWRWAREHQQLVGTLAASLLVLVATVVMAFVLITRAKHEAEYLAEEKAKLANELLNERNDAITARAEAESNARRERDARHRADEQTALAREALYDVQMARVRDALRSEPGSVRALLDDVERCPPELRDFAWGYYSWLANQAERTLATHPGVFYKVVVSPNGRTLAAVVSGKEKKSIRTWDLVTMQELWAVEDPPNAIACLAYSPDGKTLASAGADMMIHLWNAETGEAQPSPFAIDRTLLGVLGNNGEGGCLVTGTLADSPAAEAGLQPDDLLVRLDGEAVTDMAMLQRLVKERGAGAKVELEFVRNEERKTVTATLMGRRDATVHLQAITSVAYSPNGGVLATASSDGWVRLWDTESGRLETELEEPGRVNGLQFTPDGARLPVVGDQGFSLWDWQEGERVERVAGLQCSRLAMSLTGDRVAYLTGLRDIHLYSLATGELEVFSSGHTFAVASLAFSPDGTRLASGGHYTEGTIRIWNVATQKEELKLQDEAVAIFSLTFVGNNTLISGTNAGRARIWSVGPIETRPAMRLPGHTKWITAVAVSADGSLFASSAEAVRLWHAETGTAGPVMSDHGNFATAVAFSPVGSVLATTGSDRTIRLWEPESGTESASAAVEQSVLALTISPDGNVLLGAGAVEVYLWNIQKLLSGANALEGKLEGAAYAGAFAPDRPVLALAVGSTVRLLNSAQPSGLLSCEGHTKAVVGLAFSLDGMSLATAAHDNTARLWNAVDGSLRVVLEGHTQPVVAVAFSPDGRSLATASWDGTIRIWNPRTGQLRATLSGHMGAVLCLAFSRDSRTLISGGHDKQVLVWRTEFSEGR